MGVPEVVEARGMHAEGGEDAGHLAQFLRRPDADGAVPLCGHPVDGAEAFGRLAVPLQDTAVHLVRHLDQRVVRRHLPAVELGETTGETCPQLGGDDGVHDSGSEMVSIGSCPRSRMAASTRCWARRWAAVCGVCSVRFASASTAAALARSLVEIIEKMSSGSTVNGE